MLDGNVFVFDNVVHMYDLSDDNLKRPDSGGVRLSKAAIEGAERMPGAHSPWVGPSPV
jgi:hypothetical protein